MKIRRVEISGFKSFADRVVFSFDDGITGVVGPNGCGKSNVVDAVRWAMGEQSAKHLRGRAMEDVIFSGSESRPATGMAEVSLTFQNDGRLVPPQYAGFGEITVTRRLFRNGDSEYEINKTACRLLDITELFLGTGVGTRAYSIIEQGRIGLIVSAKPEDRRAIIEEAAGVTKYKARRKQAERKLEATEQNLQVAQREREAIAARQAQHEEEAGLLGVRLELLAREEDGLQAERQKLADATAEDEVRRQQAEEDLRAAMDQIHAAQHAVETERHQAVGVLTRLANHRTNLVNLERRKQELSARLLKAEGEAGQLAARTEEISRQREELSQKLHQAQADRRSLHERHSAQEEELQQGMAERRDLEALLIRVREELADRRSRLTSLLELQKNFEGYGRGVKGILLRDEDERRRDGVYGLVADVLRAEPRHEHAIEAVLGERLQLVLVESHAAGLRAVDYLKQAARGRASLVPLTEMEQLPLVPEAAELPAPEGTVRAADVVHCAPEHEKLKRYLLADVFLCETLATALALWARDPGERTFVSADGEVVDKEGIVSGGSQEGVADGLLHKRRELQELAETVQELEARLQQSTGEAEQWEALLQSLETSVKRLQQEEREEELSQVRLERDVGRLQEELARLSQRDQVLRHETEQLQQGVAEVEREETQSREAVSGGESEQQEREARLRALQADLLRAREQSEAVQAEVTRAKVSAAAVAERREGVGRSLARLSEQRSEIEARREKLEGDVLQGKERAAALEAKGEVTRDELQGLLAEGERLREELGRARALYDQAQARLRGGDEEVRAERGELEQLARRRSDAELRVQEVRLILQHLEQSTRERHLQELSEVAANRRNEALRFDAEAAEQRMQELREKIEGLGEVSLTAIDEAKEVGDRFAFLTAQKQDLEESLRKLRSAIERIDRASKERFRETFQLVDERFQQVFPRLFRGGYAELQLVEDPHNPAAEPGVEIVAQPPGKKLVSVNLLSGGEKALTAVSLIFAIFLIKPTPFCLLDEVDAPLDEANVGRYNEMVREMSRSSQFIVITHNKRTMEVADSLYGITMEEPGISKTVSVKLSQKPGATVAA